MSTFITKYAREHGLKKMDAKAPLTVTLLPADIKKAKQKDSTCCAFARASKRQFGAKSATFFRSAAWLEFGDRMLRFVLPPSVQKEIVSFDRSKVMAPGVYQLSPPPKSATLRSVSKRSKKRPGRHQPGSGRIKRGVVHRTQLIRTTAAP